jgi:hypothetical protein
MSTHRRAVRLLAGPGIAAARHVYVSVPSDAVRVAALVEISAAAAALARTVVKLRRLDPDLIATHVSDRMDMRAVLGRGRWLPTMTRHVPEPAAGPVDIAALFPAVLPAPASASHRSPTRRRAGAGLPVRHDRREGVTAVALHITDVRISSDVAGCDSVAERDAGGWTITGHPDARFTRDQAVTAMLLAEVYATKPPAEHRIWRHVVGWRRELGLTERGASSCRS